MSRRRARTCAVEVLYAADVRGAEVAELLDDREDADDYCRRIVGSVMARRGEIDALIGAHARRWPTERLSAVDRNVMRVAVLELMEGEVPPPVVIDEAVSLAKRFSGQEAGRFVNGVLEAVRQDRSTGEAGGSSDGGSSGGTGGGSTGDGDGSGAS